MKKLLFITNGHGEDLVAKEIIKALGDKFEISVLPLVGEGKAFSALKVEVVGPQKSFPSGGFSLRNPWFLAQDLWNGFLSNSIEQYKICKTLKGQIALTIAIGDIVPLLGALAVKAPIIFVGVNKSSYYKRFGFNYTPWEKQLLQSWVKKVFVRDKVTETELKNRGIKIPSAEYVGNPLMDCISTINNYQLSMINPSTELGINEGKIIIGLLPGTREDARLNLEGLSQVAEEIKRVKDKNQPVQFLTATTLTVIPAGIENCSFSDLLSRSHLVIGLSGTGNEQAAGSGLPVVSFYGRGAQYNKRFAEAQKQLLGDALSLVRDTNPLAIAAEVLQLIRSPSKRQKMAAEGKLRMGERGASSKIAAYIMGLLQDCEIGKNFNFFDSKLVSSACDNKKIFPLKHVPSSKIEIFCHFATVPL